MLLSLFLSSIIILLVIITVLLIFAAKARLMQNIDSVPWLNPEKGYIFDINTLPAIVNSLMIFLYNSIYDVIGNKMNNYENHKILSSYENSFVAKFFMF